MPNMTHPAETTEDDLNKMKDAEEWDTLTLALDRVERERDGLLEYAAKLKIELEGTRMNLRNAMSAGEAHLAELAKAAIEVHDLREEKEYSLRMTGMWRRDFVKLETLTCQLVKAQQQNNQGEWVAVIDALRKHGEAAIAWNEGDAPIAGAGTTAKPMENETGKDDALNTLAKVFHNGEEMEGEDGAVMVVDLALWNEGCEAIETLIGGEEDDEV